MPRVFVPMQPSRFDVGLKNWVPTVNLEPASKFGEVIVMLEPGANRAHTVPLANALKEKMRDYGKDDYFVALGDPSIIAIGAIIARDRAGFLRLLKWDRSIGDYIEMEIRV